MEQARRIKQREDNIRARAAAKKANKGKRGKPVSILIENIVSIFIDILYYFSVLVLKERKRDLLINKLLFIIEFY